VSSTRIKTVRTGSNKPKPRQEAESKNKSKERGRSVDATAAELPKVPSERGVSRNTERN